MTIGASMAQLLAMVEEQSLVNPEMHGGNVLYKNPLGSLVDCGLIEHVTLHDVEDFFAAQAGYNHQGIRGAAAAILEKRNLNFEDLKPGAQAALVSGLTIDNWLVVDSTSNVTVSRNFINHGSYSTISYSTNVQFIQNYSNANLEMHYSTVTITNNIFYNNSYLNHNYTTTTISNNIFDRNSNSYSVLNLGSGSSSNFSNNILINSATSASSTICGGCGAALTATNNVSSDSTFRGTNNAVLNAGITTIFSQYNNSNTSFDSKYILTSGSPALGAGTGNTDAGIFAGINSYVLSGIPFIPNIYGLEIPNIGTTGSGLKVRIKAQTNN